MKLIKKIAAIMFAFIMVFSLSTNVKAESGSQEAKTKGKITISNAIEGQEYKIYKIFDLESYSYNAEPKDGAYSYKITEQWKKFFSDEPGKDYATFDNETEYVTWKGENTDARAAELAKAAIAYAKDTTNSVTAVNVDQANISKTPNTNGTVTLTYSNLDLGYYLVDSSVGALCGLTTTANEATINEKNEKPTLNKYVNTYDAKHPNLADKNSLEKNTTNEIGDIVWFTAEIDNFKGAEQLVFTDIMDSGLSLNGILGDQVIVQVSLVKRNVTENVTNADVENLRLNTHYTTVPSNEDGKDKFTLEFTPEGYKQLEQYYENYVLRISYSATVNKSALINNENTATLKYGNSPSVLTSNAYVGVLSIPVLKTKTDNTKLKGAEFSLYKTLDDANNGVNAIAFKQDDVLKETYRKALVDETGTVNIITTNDTGKFEFYGLKEGDYYLKEVKAPEGYNKLKDPIKVTVNKKVEDGTNKINGYSLYYTYGKNSGDGATEVQVINETGSLLPSTGGMGTTLIYLIGAALVLGSGIVLANKKRAKAK